MHALLLSVAVPLLLCFGSVFVCANGGNTTRMTLFEAYSYTTLTRTLRDDFNQFVYSYHVPSLAESKGVIFAVAEARYNSYALHYAGEVVSKYTLDQGNTWKTTVATGRKTTNTYSRSINPTVFPFKKSLSLLAERFEDWTYDWTDYKNGNGDFVCSSLHKVIYGERNNQKSALMFFQPNSLIPQLSKEMERLQIKRLIGGYGRGIEVNGTSIVPVWYTNKKNEVRPTVLLFGSPNWRLAQGTGDAGSLESAVVEWEGKLIMNARTNDGYRKVYESTDMGNTWKEALGSLSRVWGNAPNRQGIGCSASFITVTIENTPVMLFSYPLNTKGGENRDQLHLWVTDNKRIYDVGQISADDENTGHSSLLYTNGTLYCLYEKERYKTIWYYSSVLAHLVDELKKIKAIVKKWKIQDRTFSGSCDSDDSSSSYPGSTCEVHIPQKGLVGFLSDESTTDKWKDAYSCVDAEIKGGVRVKNGIKFNASGAGAMWPVGKQGQNQRYHFMNHEFTLAATVIIHESIATNTTSLVSVVLDTKDHKKIIDGGPIITGNSSIKEHELKEGLATLATDKPVRLVLTFQNGTVKLYLEGNFTLSQTYTLTSELLSTPISHICILQCGENKLKEHPQVTVQNVLLYNRVLSNEEMDLLYLPIIPTKTPTISKTISHTNSLSKTLSTTETPSRSLSRTITQSLSHTLSESQSLSHTYDVIRERSQKEMKRDSSFKREQNKHFDNQPELSVSTQKPMHTSDKVCPSIIVKTFPAGDLTQKDIDGSNNGKRLLLVSLPKQLNWPINDSFSSLISFSGGSGTAQPNGFSGEWGKMLRNVTWSRNTTNPRSVLKTELPTCSDYNIVSDEEIVICVDARALSVDCQGSLNGSFTIHAKNASQVVKGSKAFDVDISSMATVTILFAGGAGSIFEIQALSLLSRMNCAFKEERDGINLLPYLTSFFAHFGSLWIVLGNTLIVVIFGSIHYCTTVLYKQMRGGDSSKAWARMFFPSFTYFVAYIMHIGIFVHSVSLLFIIKAEWHHYFVGIAGTSYGLMFPFFVLYRVAHYMQVKCVPYPYFINQSYFKRWMAPHGYWTPLNQVQMYGSIFFTMKDKHLYWCVFRLSVVCIAGIVTVIPISTENCHMQYFCLMGIFLFGSIATAIANMMRSVFLTSMHTLSFFLLGTLCFISGINSVSPTKLSFNVYFLFTVMLLVVLFITFFYKACLLFYDWMYMTDHAMDSITMKEPFTEGKCEKYDTKRNTLPFGKEDPFVSMQSENGKKIRNEPYGK